MKSCLKSYNQNASGLLKARSQSNLNNYSDDESLHLKAHLEQQFFAKTKIFLIKQERKKQELKLLSKKSINSKDRVTSSSSSNKRIESTMKASEESRSSTARQTASSIISFEKKLIFSKKSDQPIDLDENNRITHTVEMLSADKAPLTIPTCSSLLHLARIKSCTKPAPLRNLLDNGRFVGNANGDKKFSAYVLSDPNKYLFFAKKSQDHDYKQRELYNRFRSSLSNQFSRRTPVANIPTPSFLLNPKC